MLTCIPCTVTKGIIKDITNHIKGISTRSARMRDGRKPKGSQEAAAVESEKGTGEEADEWVAEPETGVHIILVQLPDGRGNTLKKIRFNQEFFNAYGAQKWWSDNYDKIMELYTIPSSQSSPAPSIAEADRVHNTTGSAQEQQLMNPTSAAAGSSRNASDAWTHTSEILVGESSETNSAEESVRKESELVVEEEPGVYLTLRSMPNGDKELLRVELSRERFGEVKARVWWEENKARLQEQYTVDL